MKTWKPGVADEPWKVEVCRRDIALATETLEFLVHVLTDCPDMQRGVAALRAMTGEDIVGGIEAYRDAASTSIVE